MEFYTIITPVLIASAIMGWRLRNMAKHDTVLYKFCQIRRETMNLIRERNFNLSKADYIALRELAEETGDTIHDFNNCKVALFNLRRYEVQVRRVKSLDEVEIGNPELQKLYNDFGSAMVTAFLTFTPFFVLWAITYIAKFLASVGGKYLKAEAKRLEEIVSWVEQESNSHAVS